MGKTQLNKYVFSLVGISAVILMGLVVVILGMQNYLAGSGTQNVPRPDILPTAQPARAARAAGFPRAVVSEWGSIPARPSFQPPVRTTLYAFKQQYTSTDFMNVAQYFIPVVPTNVRESKNSISMVAEGGGGMFFMYKPSGSFYYRSATGLALNGAGADRDRVAGFMRDLWNDDTLQVTGSYARTSTPGITYYELHRDWDKVGLPIVNLIGSFNVPLEEQIGTLSLVGRTPAAADADVVGTDNGTNGRARNTDFNTATVGVQDGRIVSVASNIRQVNLQESRPYAMISYDQAVAKLKNGNYLHLFTSPAGEGDANAGMVYENNSVTLEKVTVRESLAAYLEDLPAAPQTYLFPYFVFRGEARSTTGYRMNFVAAVSAVSDTVLGSSTIAQNNQNEIPVGSNQSQQQGTLRFMDPTANPVPVTQEPGITVVPTQPPEQVDLIECVPPPSPKDLENITSNVTGQVYGQYMPPAGSLDDNVLNNEASQIRRTYSKEWFIMPQGAWDVYTLKTAVNRVWDEIQTIPGSERQRRIEMVILEFNAVKTGCPVRITGVSPTLFVYGSRPTVTSGASITYSDPPRVNNQWTAFDTPIYYEYRKVGFPRPKQGWNTERNAIGSLAAQISNSLRLTASEAEALKHELINTSRLFGGRNVFVGVIPAAEVDSRIPLNVTGTSSVLRYHFYIGTPIGPAITPELTPVARQHKMVLEVGATVE